ncbi:MAG: rod shape-determining protein MreC [Bacteroidales bacterium]|nr:rod shape-determining protein MreC [Bacteroidales bacterium]
MWNLIRFFTKNSPFFTWLFLAIISLILLFQSNPYHRSIWFGSANAVTGSLYQTSNNITGYFSLRSINQELLEQIGEVEAENVRLRQCLAEYSDQVDEENRPEWQKDAAEKQFEFMLAHVVSNSVNQAQNYLTLDKGEADGVRVGMGVAAHNGVVGIVANTSEHYSLVISMLNPKLRLSAGLSHNGSFGSLQWDGKSTSICMLEDIARNSKAQVGDSVVTTGYAASFPKGVPIGRIIKVDDKKGNNNFFVCKVELFTDFARLNDVNIIVNKDQDEIEKLQQTFK